MRFCIFSSLNHIAHAHIQVVQSTAPLKIQIPRRIQARWAKHHNLPQQICYKYKINSSLEKAKVSRADFKACWTYVHPRLSEDALFSLFKDSGFSTTAHDITGRLAFVRNVLQQYEDPKVFFSVYQYACIVYVFVHLIACA